MWPTVQIAALGGSAAALATRRLGGRARRGGERGEDRIEPLHDVRFAANHETVSALEAEDAAARAAVYVMHSALGEPLRARDVVSIEGITAIDHNVSGGQLRNERLERLVHHGGGHHQPDGARRSELRHEIIELRRARRALGAERLHGGGGSS